MPNTKIISDFYVVNWKKHADGIPFDESVIRIISMDDKSKTAFIKDLLLCIWEQVLDYDKAINVIKKSGEAELLKIAAEMVDPLVNNRDIYLQKIVISKNLNIIVNKRSMGGMENEIFIRGCNIRCFAAWL